MKSNEFDNPKYQFAKKRVEDLKGFYLHLTIFIIINLFISGNQIHWRMKDGELLEDILTGFPLYSVWIFWGIGLFFHALRVFGYNLIFGADWEKRKIKEIMDKKKQG